MAYEFPPDLLEIQRRFFDAEERASNAEGEAFTEAFRDQQQAAIDKHRHPWWETVGNRFKADMALREAARETSPTAE